MSVDVQGFVGSPYLETHLSPGGFVVLGLYALLTLALLFRSRHHFRRLTTAPGASLFAATLLLAPLLARLLSVQLGAPVLAANPGTPGPVAGFEFALLAALPLLVAAAWLGPGPAILVGLASGLARAGWDTSRLTQPLEMALWAGVMGTLLRQPYRGRIGQGLRQPLLTALLSAVALAWPLTLLALGFTGSLTGIASLEKTLALGWPTLIAYVGEALIAGLLVQLLFQVRPHLRPVDRSKLVSPPWARRLNRRILLALTPLALLAIVILVGGVAAAAYRVATNIVIDQMARDAAMVSNELPFFVQIGRSLVQDLATDERLHDDDGEVRQARLAEGLRAVPFFQQLIAFDRDGNLTNAYPDTDAVPFDLSPEEERLVRLALEGGIPGENHIQTQQNDSPVFMSFAAPLRATQEDQPAGVLLGRASFGANPLMQPVVDILRGVLVDSGEGLIIDEANTILLYPAHPERQSETLDLTAATQLRTASQPGQVLREIRPDRTQQLVYRLPIRGHSEWSVVVMVPNQVVLALAVQIALPTLITLLVMASLGVAAMLAVATRLTEPLEMLAQAADRIAAGQLDHAVTVAGEDEIGRLGLAFEDMRHGLKARLDEQETLLNVSYAVSANLELYRALPPILSAALEATGALGVRIALVRPDGSLQTFAGGEGAAGMAPMDQDLVEHADSQGALVVSRIERASPTLKSSALVPRIRSLVALPIRSETRFLGLLWLAYAEEHQFEQAELTFLSNLASQASFATANARLFEAAEGGRRQLAAILSSTTDAVLVVDNNRRLLLINPAAEKAFGIIASRARNRDFETVITQPELANLLGDLDGATASVELSRDDGRTLLANASPIVAGDGKPLGRVVLLSDITYLKELDDMKSAFVSTVSHDLRAPLTFMSGYLTMLPMVGDLNEKQKEFAGKIKTGIEQMTVLIAKLLNLGRIEAGAPLDLEACDLKALATSCHAALIDQARAKKLEFKLDLPAYLPHVPADTTLYRMAVTNLLENAVKFTPEGGAITLSASSDDDKVTIAVSDTGPGISPDDLEHLFQPFFRAKDHHTSTTKGSGLGLAIVKGVAERHAGRARVESQPGEGSTFFLEMPLQQPEP